MTDGGFDYKAVFARVIGQRLEAAPPTNPEDWESTLQYLFPRFASKPFSKHHRRFWEHVWRTREGWSPEPIGLFLPRGHGKSSTAEMFAASAGAMGKRKFCLYVCANQFRADEHVTNIAALLESEGVASLYPDASKPKVGRHGNRRGWSQSQLQTANGFTVRALGFDGAIRGVKVEDARPDLIVLDDIDEVTDTPKTVAKKINILTKSILGTKAEDVLVIFAQNLIHPGSVAAKVARRDADFLRDIIRIGPVKAVDDFKYGVLEDGFVEISGVPSWPEGMSLETCSRMINAEMGLAAFLTECQQEVDIMRAGLIFPGWRETHHIITRSEFARGLGLEPSRPGEPFVPPDFTLGVGHDWGGTLGHPSTVTVWGRPPEGSELDDCVFKLSEMVMPLEKEEEAEMTPVFVGKAMQRREDEIGASPHLVQVRSMSHEALSERRTYAMELDPPLIFGVREAAGRSGGIAQLSTYYAIDYTQPHPFRRFPEGHPQAGRPLMGRPRAYWVVADDQGGLTWDAEMEELRVKQAKEGDDGYAWGMKRGRWEITVYHWDTSMTGEEKQRPYPNDNDVMDADRFIGFDFFPSKKPLSPAARASRKAREAFEDRQAAYAVADAGRPVDVATADSRLVTALIDLNTAMAQATAPQGRGGKSAVMSFRLHRRR